MVNKNTLSLPKSLGGFNVHNITTKITALRINTIKRLLEPTQAHWKCFLADYLRTQAKDLGIHTLTTQYKTKDIDPDLPIFHKELLKAWVQFQPHITRTDRPSALQDIKREPLFDNTLIKDKDENTLHNKKWIQAGLTKVDDICYLVAPGLMPIQALHEQLTDIDETITIEQTEQQLNEIVTAIPKQWHRVIDTQPHITNQTHTNLGFVLKPNARVKEFTDLQKIKTNTIYKRLRDSIDHNIPAIAHWTTQFPTQAINGQFWLPRNHDLITNKRKDFDWKIKHRALPTAKRLHDMTVHNTPNCHHCNATETIEHLLLHCTQLRTFWTHIQTITDAATDSTVTLDDQTKLFGTTNTGQTPQDHDKYRLLNWILNTARFAIHKSAVMKRIYNTNHTPHDIFRAGAGCTKPE